MGSVIKFPLQMNKVEICCHDSDQYFFTLALCQYKSPKTLIKELLVPESYQLQRLSMQESMEKANKLIGNTTVIFDDDDEGGSEDANGSKDDGKFVFSLVDPFSMIPMTTPVRGKKCKHWQCFELSKFMHSNECVSGSRWRCACCEIFLPYHDLQLCGLTKAALKKFGKRVNSNQGRVEYSVNGEYELLGPQKLRYANKKRSANGNTGKAQSNPVKQPVEEIVLID
jgi:hypothetical protein